MAMNVDSAAPDQVKNDINVTPLIDVLLVLLIIFLVIIPVMMKMETLQVPPKPCDDCITKDNPLTVKVKADLSVTIDDGTVETPVAAPDLAKTLRPRLEALDERVVFVDYEDGVPWKHVVGTMDAIRSLASDASHDEVKVALKVKEGPRASGFGPPEK
jgi:biopolymer transport protein TolR